MRRRYAVVSLAFAGFFAACSSDSPVAPDGADLRSANPNAAQTYIVTFRDGVTDVGGFANSLARRGGFQVDAVRLHAARGFTAVIPARFVAELRADPNVLIVEADYAVQLRLPEETAKPGGGGGSAGQQASYGVARVGGSRDGSGKTAWIIDTGIDLDHPDLNTTKNCHRNFVARSSSPDDGNGHGTHVAGIVAAKNNGIGTLGVAAGAFVCAVRVLDNRGSGQYSWIIAGVDYVAGAAASGDAANMSLGGSGINTSLEKAVSDAAGRGVRFALAAGNDGADANNFTPARVNGTNIKTISAINASDCMASWSNYGNPPVDFAAPGVSILSLYRGGGTKTLSGTSMASPHVAGLLLFSNNISSSGTASCDRDGNPDPIAHS